MLTLLSGFALPLNFLTGFNGMNVPPEELFPSDGPFAGVRTFWLLIGLCVAAIVLLAVRHRWLE